MEPAREEAAPDVAAARKDETNPSLALDIPAGYVGPLAIPGSGRQVWWTGRVAIGLRYEPPPEGLSQGGAKQQTVDVKLGD